MKHEIEELDSITAAVHAKKKYENIHPGLIRSIAESELAKGRRGKEAVKEVAAKLHQVAASYFLHRPNYQHWMREFKELSGDIENTRVRYLCEKIMQQHSSTAERLPILQNFFHHTLNAIKPVSSIVDLACGLNPLALTDMPLDKKFEYYGCDIFTDMTDFLNQWFDLFEINAQVENCNLLDLAMGKRPIKQAQVTFLLKALTCLDQLEKDVGISLLQRIPSQFILVSYPVASLGGHQKGMLRNYEKQFLQLISGHKWQVDRFIFETELAFLVKK